MRKLVSIIIGITLLAGCAVRPPAYVTQKQSNQHAIEKIQKIEILYHADDEYPIIDRGGSGMTGMAGLLGPVGLLIAVGADAGSKLSVAERAASRSKEFTKAIHVSFPDQGLNSQFANKLADLLRASGRTVRLTQVERPVGNDILSMSTIKGVQQSEGYAPLVLRITTGYGADSATSSYRPILVTEYVLKDEAKKVLVENKETSNEGEKTYLTYQGLLEDHIEAREQLRHGLMSLAAVAYKKMFDMNESGSK